MKEALRKQALATRALGGDAVSAVARLTEALRPFAGQVLSGYWPIRDELDPRSAMKAHDGPLCLPVVPGRAVPLIFRSWNGKADSLERGSFGTFHPAPHCPEIRPQVLIVPLAAFDRSGARLGYGGGYYDRTLALLRASGPVTAIGFAYAVQEMPDLPQEPTDQPLDLIVTDREIIRPEPPTI